MKFLVDAQLPFELSKWLCEKGYDSIHTCDLKDGNKTPDRHVLKICLEQRRILVTKDADFLTSHYLVGEPEKLLILKTGNIRNAILLNIFAQNHSKIVNLFRSHSLLELGVEHIAILR